MDASQPSTLLRFNKPYGVLSQFTAEGRWRGLQLNDGITLPAQAQLISEPPALWPRTPPVRVRRNIPTAWLELCITEGRNRQVRRMTAAVGLPCLRLIRSAIGPYNLDGLAPAAYDWVVAPDVYLAC